MIRQQVSLTNRLTHHSTTLTNKRRQWRTTRAEHCRLKSGLPLMRDWAFRDPISVIKLTLSSHLNADKHFPVNPKAITGPLKMSILLEAKSTPTLIIKPWLILVAHTDDLGWYITSNQHWQKLVKKKRLSAIQMLRQGRSCIAPQTVFQLTWCCTKTFLLT